MNIWTVIKIKNRDEHSFLFSNLTKSIFYEKTHYLSNRYYKIKT